MCVRACVRVRVRVRVCGHAGIDEASQRLHPRTHTHTQVHEASERVQGDARRRTDLLGYQRTHARTHT